MRGCEFDSQECHILCSSEQIDLAWHSLDKVYLLLSQCIQYETHGVDPGCDGHLWNVKEVHSLASKSFCCCSMVYGMVLGHSGSINKHLWSVLGFMDKHLGVFCFLFLFFFVFFCLNEIFLKTQKRQQTCLFTTDLTTFYPRGKIATSENGSIAST